MTNAGPGELVAAEQTWWSFFFFFLHVIHTFLNRKRLLLFHFSFCLGTNNKEEMSRTSLRESFVFIINVVRHQCSSLSVKICTFPYQKQLRCQFTFISVLIPLDLLWMILLNHISIKSKMVPAPLWCHSPQGPSFPETLWPWKREKRRDLVFHVFALSCQCCPLLGITLPVEQIKERKWMPASALLMAKLAQL